MAPEMANAHMLIQAEHFSKLHKPAPFSVAVKESFTDVRVPLGDGPYTLAKRVQVMEKNPDKAIALFWAAINAGDRVDSALKDMAVLMKQQNRPEEAIEAIRSLRHRCSDHAQESLDNVLLDLYKKCGRLDDQIELLKCKLHFIHEGIAFNGKRTKTARCQGKKFQVSIEKEATRLLGNLGWAYMQQSNYLAAEAVYRKALSIEPDHNKFCNLGICLMKLGRLNEAKVILKSIEPPNSAGNWSKDSHGKSYERAQEVLHEIEGINILDEDPIQRGSFVFNFDSADSTLFATSGFGPLQADQDIWNGSVRKLHQSGSNSSLFSSQRLLSEDDCLSSDDNENMNINIQVGQHDQDGSFFQVDLETSVASAHQSSQKDEKFSWSSERMATDTRSTSKLESSRTMDDDSQNRVRRSLEPQFGLIGSSSNSDVPHIKKGPSQAIKYPEHFSLFPDLSSEDETLVSSYSCAERRRRLRVFQEMTLPFLSFRA